MRGQVSSQSIGSESGAPRRLSPTWRLSQRIGPAKGCARRERAAAAADVLRWKAGRGTARTGSNRAGQAVELARSWRPALLPTQAPLRWQQARTRCPCLHAALPTGAGSPALIARRFSATPQSGTSAARVCWLQLSDGCALATAGLPLAQACWTFLPMFLPTSGRLLQRPHALGCALLASPVRRLVVARVEGVCLNASPRQSRKARPVREWLFNRREQHAQALRHSLRKPDSRRPGTVVLAGQPGSPRPRSENQLQPSVQRRAAW